MINTHTRIRTLTSILSCCSIFLGKSGQGRQSSGGSRVGFVACCLASSILKHCSGSAMNVII